MARGKYERNFGVAQCDYCHAEFTRRMAGQRFCRPQCRELHHEGAGLAREVLTTLRDSIDKQLAELSADR